MSRLLFGHDRVVAEWVGKNLEIEFRNIVFAVGTLDPRGRLTGGGVLHDHSRYDVELTCFGPGAMRAALFRALARLTFVELECLRCTLRIPRRRGRLVGGALKLGFKHEGLVRRLYGPHRADDAIIMGLLRRDAGRFLGEVKE